MVAARALAGSAVPVPAAGPLGPVTPEAGKPGEPSSADAAADDTVAGGRP
jgi:hypothetical protein